MKTLLTIFFSFFLAVQSYAGTLDHYQDKVNSLGAGIPMTRGTLVSTVGANAISQPILAAIGAFSLPALVGVAAVAAMAGATYLFLNLRRRAFTKVIALYKDALDGNGKQIRKLQSYLSRKLKRKVEILEVKDLVIETFLNEEETAAFSELNQKRKLLTYRKFRKLILKKLKSLEA